MRNAIFYWSWYNTYNSKWLKEFYGEICGLWLFKWLVSDFLINIRIVSSFKRLLRMIVDMALVQAEMLYHRRGLRSGVCISVPVLSLFIATAWMYLQHLELEASAPFCLLQHNVNAIHCSEHITLLPFNVQKVDCKDSQTDGSRDHRSILKHT